MSWRIAFILGLVWGALMLSPGAAESLQGGAIIDVTQTQIRHSGSHRRVEGESERWVYQIHNKRITVSAIGYSILNCTFIGSGGPLGSLGVWDCTAVYAFAKGKIVARGLVKRRALYALAVVGGTGLYSNVGGQMLATTYDEAPHQERLLFGLEAIG